MAEADHLAAAELIFATMRPFNPEWWDAKHALEELRAGKAGCALFRWEGNGQDPAPSVRAESKLGVILTHAALRAAGSAEQLDRARAAARLGKWPSW